jgi:Spy/CpxP family protein refolding chaperone
MNCFRVLLICSLLAVLGNSAALAAEPVRNRDQVQERIETLLMWKMMDTLNLDKATADKVFEIRRKYVGEQKQIQKTLEDDFRKLRHLLRDSPSSLDDRDLVPLITNIRKQRKRLHAMWTEQYEEVSKVLTVRQQAELLLLLKDFRKEIRAVLRPPLPPPPPSSFPGDRRPERRPHPPEGPAHVPEGVDGPPDE